MKYVLLKSVKCGEIFSYEHTAYIKGDFIRKYGKYKCLSILSGHYCYLNGYTLVHPLNN